MLRGRSLAFALLVSFGLLLPSLSAETISYSGSLSDSTDTFLLPITLSQTDTLVFQTFGFGGGVNGNGGTIASGGFDPLLALFSGTGDSASIYNIGGDPNSPAGTSDDLANFNSFAGCPPAGLVDIGTGPGSAVCGDINMTVTLSAGTYTLLLADADYIPNALLGSGTTLGDGFTDFTNGVFQTCNTNNAGTTTCINPSAQYAFDVTDQGSSAPEPTVFVLFASGLLAIRLAGGRMKPVKRSEVN